MTYIYSLASLFSVSNYFFLLHSHLKKVRAQFSVFTFWLKGTKSLPSIQYRQCSLLPFSSHTFLALSKNVLNSKTGPDLKKKNKCKVGLSKHSLGGVRIGASKEHYRTLRCISNANGEGLGTTGFISISSLFAILVSRAPSVRKWEVPFHFLEREKLLEQ